MNYRKFFIFTMTCVVLLMSMHAFAGTGKRIATAGAMELLIPVGSQATALSGANLSSVSGIEAMYWNPAGVVTGPAAQVMFSHLKWIGDTDINYIAGMVNLGAVGAIGLNIKTLSFGDIAETTVEAPDGTGSTFSPNYLTIGMNYSRKMTDRIHFGVNVKLISEKIMSVQATGVGFDIGLQYISIGTGLRLGVVLSNFGGTMKFSGSDLETRVALPGTEAGSTISSVAIPIAAFDLPTQLKFGVSYDLKLGDDNAASVMGSFVNNAYAYDQYILGAEYGFKNMFFLRGAYSVAFREGMENAKDGFVTNNEDYLFGPSFGAGLKLGLSGNMSVSMDYSYRTAKYFNDNQWFSVILGF
jgi:hypothetical protein